ncbi:unnamed protein product [Protopolystoma xenopodis]|uniref:DNA/RNA-binding domain-containing protein n=1 Tax=Protopolystoma xenopodis TaxID=117903 RepID=A0A3S5CCC4_9PLAT|nr:unnamed protein product [Protopolystoma xenopodis]
MHDNSRHLDAMYYYMRTLAATNPFPTASQSLSALFGEMRGRAERALLASQRDSDSSNSHGSNNRGSVFSSFLPTCRPGPPGICSRYRRAEVWIHPIDGAVTLVQGNRSLSLAARAAAAAADVPKRRGCSASSTSVKTHRSQMPVSNASPVTGRRRLERGISGKQAAGRPDVGSLNSAASGRAEPGSEDGVAEDDEDDDEEEEDNEEYDEDAQAEAEEYANNSLIQK